MSTRKALVFCALLAGGCHTPSDPQRVPWQPQPAPIAAPKKEAPPPVVNQDIMICGRHVPIGTPIVLWTEAPFYDATKTGPRFTPTMPGVPPKLRYQPGRVRKIANPDYVAPPKAGEPDTRTADEREETIVAEVLVRPDETDPAALRDVVDQFVLHHDVCGLSRTCFRVLQDERNLSVHFLLDLDGTIYQTMDLRETGWHAKRSNTRSIGVEIANIGAYSAREAWHLEAWYEHDERGARITIPTRIKETGLRTPNFVGFPARGYPLIGRIQGDVLHQFDYTPEQYQSLVKLAAALCREFPKISPDAPRDEAGFVVDHVLDDDAWRAFHGILGHYHVQLEKNDPGPAFDWEPFLSAVRDRISGVN